MEELLVPGDVAETASDPSEDPAAWARDMLHVPVNPHDGMQTAFVATLRNASLQELRVLVCTYEGLDAIAATPRRAELAWKATAARAALAARTAAVGAPA